MSATPLKVAVLASGRGSNLAALLAARDRGELPVDFVLVGSDKASAHALQLAKAAGIATLALSPRNYPDRRSFDLNYENNMLICDAGVTAALRSRQEAFLAKSLAVLTEEVEGWPWYRRLANNLLAIVSPLL